MRDLLKPLRDRLDDFLDQANDLALVLRSPDADALPVLKALELMEDTHASEFFWTFTDAFTDPASYAEAVVKGFATTHGAVRLAMEKEGMAPWPPIPPGIRSERTEPAQRLRELAAFSRELLPVPNGGNVVWIFYPLASSDPWGFATLMREVLRHEFPFPWCHHLRFILREDPAAPALQALLPGTPRVAWYEPDLGAEAVRRSMEAEIADESLPIEERLGTLMVMAGSDFAVGNYAAALEKYELLLSYHASAGNPTMAAMALNGMGETYERLGDVERADESYQAALIPASDGEHPPIPIFLNVVLNLANLRYSQQMWAEGEAYYDAAQELATVARDGATKVRALEYRGICQQQQGDLAGAEASWNAGAVIAAQLEDLSQCRSLVERLQQLYAVTGQVLKEQERREQLAALGGARG